MIKYIFRDDIIPPIANAAKANPQLIGEALAKVADANGGRIKPIDVVAEAASNPTLHQHFEWDDRKAAIAHRLDQARVLLRVIRIDDDTSSDQPRAFLSITEKSGTAYRTLQDVINSTYLQALVLKQADRDLDAFQRRYRDLEDVCDVIREARALVAARSRRPTSDDHDHDHHVT